MPESTAPSRALKAIALIACTVVCLGIAPAAVAADPSSGPAATPPATTEQAQQAKAAADRKVAQLKARIAAATQRLDRLSVAASRAENEYNGQLKRQAKVRAAEVAAKAALAVAQQDYEHARGALARMAASNYMNGGGIGPLDVSSAAGLLAATDPNALLDAVTYRELASQYQAQVTQQMIDAVTAKQAAETKQKQALAAVAAQTAKLNEIRRRAVTAMAQSRVALTAIKADMSAAKLTQAQADAQLSSFLGGWTVADPARASELNLRYRMLAARVKSEPLAPNKGTWTSEAGRSAVNRAIQWIGTPYAWAGGNAHGPTRGMCADGDAANDCRVIGFDCSGLVLYAWAPYLSMEHFAATQYTRAGKVHPSVTKLLPGDLVFWSGDTTAAGIHHVALYVGNGKVIQAPQSGDIVRITPLANVSSGYFGATRPFS